MDLLNILFSIVLLFVILYFIGRHKISTRCTKGSKTCKDENGIDIDATCNKATKTWECAPGTSNTVFKPFTGCECQDDVNITCPSGTTMQVNSGFYGRKSDTMCMNCPGTTDFCSEDTANDTLTAAAKKNAIVMGKNAYNKFYNTTICPSSIKYTTFKYRCI
jgi:hypothetical protein